MLSTATRPIEPGTEVESSLDQTQLRLLKQALFSSLGLRPVKVEKESLEPKEESPTETETEANLRAVEHLLRGLTNQAEHQASSKFQHFIDALFPLLRDLVNDLNQILSEEKKLTELIINIVPATNLEIKLAQALGLVKKEESYFYVLLEDAQPAIPAADSKEESLNRVTVTRKWILMDVEKICDDFLTPTGSPDSSGANTSTPVQFAQTLVPQLIEVIREIQQLAGTSTEQQSNKVRSPLNVHIQTKLSEAFNTSLQRVQAVVSGTCNTLGLRVPDTNKISRLGVFEDSEESFCKLVESLWENLASGTSNVNESEQNLKKRLKKILSELELGTELKPQVTQGRSVKVNNKEFPLETYIDYLEGKALNAIQELRHILPIKQGRDTILYFALMVSGGYMTEEIFKNVAEGVIKRKNTNDQYYTELHRILRQITVACTLLGMLGDEANLRLRGIQNLFLGAIGAKDPLFSLLGKLGSFATPDGVELLNSLLKETVAYTVAEKIFELLKEGIHPETSLFASADCSLDTLQVEDIAEIIKKTIITSRKGLFSLFWKFLRLALERAMSDQTSKNEVINRQLSELSVLRVSDIVRMAFKGLKEEDQDLIKQLILSSTDARHVDLDNPDGQILIALRLPGQEILGEIMFKPETEEPLGNTTSEEESSRLPHDLYSICKGFELAYRMAVLSNAA
jgi:DNA-directed RNA polymerase subunit F